MNIEWQIAIFTVGIAITSHTILWLLTFERFKAKTEERLRSFEISIEKHEKKLEAMENDHSVDIKSCNENFRRLLDEVADKQAETSTRILEGIMELTRKVAYMAGRLDNHIESNGTGKSTRSR